MHTNKSLWCSASWCHLHVHVLYQLYQHRWWIFITRLFYVNLVAHSAEIREPTNLLLYWAFYPFWAQCFEGQTSYQVTGEHSITCSKLKISSSGVCQRRANVAGAVYFSLKLYKPVYNHSHIVCGDCVSVRLNRFSAPRWPKLNRYWIICFIV